jgi:hypothetical protein
MKKYLVYLFLWIPVVGFGQFKSSIDFVGGIGYSYRLLDSKATAASLSPRFENREKEVGKISHRYGMNFNHRISYNIYFKTGVRYAKVGYKSEVKKFLFANDLQNDIASGDTGFFSIRDFQENYSYTFWEIPLMIRYEFKNQHFTPFFEIGLSPNFYVNTKTQQLLDEETFGTFTNETSDNISTISMVGSLSFGLNYPLNRHFQLFTQPIIRYHLTNFTKNIEQENLYNFGIEIGVRVALGTRSKKPLKTSAVSNP